MIDLLDNPVYFALLTGDRNLSYGSEHVKFFDEKVSPFAGFDQHCEKGFADLYDLLPPGRKILYASPQIISCPGGWQLTHEIKGLQFEYVPGQAISTDCRDILPLDDSHVEQMIQLARLTRPGPFGPRTIDFGSYFGIFDQGKLVAMTGQRLHVEDYTEISAVCTHPGHLGKGFAHQLLQHQVQLILQQNQKPFLHVREDNQRAISLYIRTGFSISRNMNFYFLKRN